MKPYTPNPALRPILGTLAHNRTFTYADLEESCYWRPSRVPMSPATLRALVRHGYVEQVSLNRHYYPTPSGWAWIERDCA